MTGNTRVTVRGGPFEDMDLLYPNPKCKFGSNDLVTHAQYVRCTEKPLEMEDIEGHHVNRVSFVSFDFCDFSQEGFFAEYQISQLRDFLFDLSGLLSSFWLQIKIHSCIC